MIKFVFLAYYAFNSKYNATYIQCRINDYPDFKSKPEPHELQRKSRRTHQSSKKTEQRLGKQKNHPQEVSPGAEDGFEEEKEHLSFASMQFFSPVTAKCGIGSTTGDVLPNFPPRSPRHFSYRANQKTQHNWKAYCYL